MKEVIKRLEECKTYLENRDDWLAKDVKERIQEIIKLIADHQRWDALNKKL
jgi:hypothetical protein